MILCTAMRNAHPYLGTWTRQVEALARKIPLKVVVVEGDSDDETYKELLGIRDAQTFDLTVLKVETGGPHWESRDIPARWRQLAVVCNVGLTAGLRLLDDTEPLAWIESDLGWEVETVRKLHQHVLVGGFPAVAPMSMQAGRFYDVWGFQKDGRRFGPYPPYHPGISADRMVTIDTAGSAIVLSNEAARVVEFSTDGCIKGIGESLYANGFSLWLDPTLSVSHP